MVLGAWSANNGLGIRSIPLLSFLFFLFFWFFILFLNRNNDLVKNIVLGKIKRDTLKKSILMKNKSKRLYFKF